MRLTCPNCSARYEVDESMIPPAGRDVQCSNCGTTWFQPGPRDLAAAEETEAESAPQLAAPETETAPTPEPQPEPEPEPTPEPAAEPTPEAEAEPPEPAPEPQPDPEPTPPTPAEPPQRQTIEPEVANILRQEAQREAELRRAEAEPDPVETQSEMPLEEAPSPRRPIPELEEAEDAFVDEAAVAATVAASGSRGELLPDIEEINSTLRATGDRTEGEADATDVSTVGSAARRRGQVRRGFFLMVLLAVIAFLLYAQADAIRAAVPQAGSFLDSYVSGVDGLRFQLDELARGLIGTTP